MPRKIAYKIMKIMYREYLRPLLVEAVEGTERDWDDKLLQFVDLIFGVTEFKD